MEHTSQKGGFVATSSPGDLLITRVLMGPDRQSSIVGCPSRADALTGSRQLSFKSVVSWENGLFNCYLSSN